jgi:hypothetical protein
MLRLPTLLSVRFEVELAVALAVGACAASLACMHAIAASWLCYGTGASGCIAGHSITMQQHQLCMHLLDKVATFTSPVSHNSSSSSMELMQPTSEVVPEHHH